MKDIIYRLSNEIIQEPEVVLKNTIFKQDLIVPDRGDLEHRVVPSKEG
jgi:hypothetical protein